MPQPRNRTQRKADTLARLGSAAVDVWVATASTGPGGEPLPYLVPLSLAWLDGRAVIAVEERSRTARAILSQRVARLGVGPTRDVTVIDAVLEEAVPVADAPDRIAAGYAAQADWDPRDAGDGYVYLVLRPERVQAWREADELPGRTLMRDGAWLV
jgi:hypothetical protein